LQILKIHINLSPKIPPLLHQQPVQFIAYFFCEGADGGKLPLKVLQVLEFGVFADLNVNNLRKTFPIKTNQKPLFYFTGDSVRNDTWFLLNYNLPVFFLKPASLFQLQKVKDSFDFRNHIQRQ